MCLINDFQKRCSVFLLLKLGQEVVKRRKKSGRFLRTVRGGRPATVRQRGFVGWRADLHLYFLNNPVWEEGGDGDITGRRQ
ncbi:hypothetical protein EYF80_062146 [Liparis tanakae]|uniref:Uncharacterized protein n=1 Tax=Liparis tanakae TaxID=230148 RepID=A0A4Z2EG34_9TELE|nr:hypothetical protein EYF80_062146 [Liparis tanakae]